MYFSHKEFHEYIQRNPNYIPHIPSHIGSRESLTTYDPYRGYIRRPISKTLSGRILRHYKTKIVERDNYDGRGKWLRPWTVVPKLRNWQAPEGDYGVGVEIEMGFVSVSAARQVANHVKNWKYITLDFEGGRYPIEATFPPTKYSSFGAKSQAYRYLKYLSANPELVVSHRNGSFVGTHVNVSKGGVTRYGDRFYSRCDSLSRVIQYDISSEEKTKYFGRSPYGYAYARTTHIEYKLFNSTTNPKTLTRYVNIAVSLTELICSGRAINVESVRAALERGYKGKVKS